jgi:hypothetical protein
MQIRFVSLAKNDLITDKALEVQTIIRGEYQLTDQGAIRIQTV